MIETYLRPIFQKFCVDPVAAWIHDSTPLTPDKVSYLAGFVGFLTIPMLWLGAYKIAIALVLLSGYLDILDGTLARLAYSSSPKGAVIDIVIDRAVEFFIIFGLYFVEPAARGATCLAMLGSVLICVTSFLVVGIFTENDSEKSFYYSPGIIERPEAFLLFIAMIAWPAAFIFLAWLFTLLVLATAALRILQFLSNNVDA